MFHSARRVRRQDTSPSRFTLGARSISTTPFLRCPTPNSVAGANGEELIGCPFDRSFFLTRLVSSGRLRRSIAYRIHLPPKRRFLLRCFYTERRMSRTRDGTRCRSRSTREFGELRERLFVHVQVQGSAPPNMILSISVSDISPRGIAENRWLTTRDASWIDSFAEASPSSVDALTLTFDEERTGKQIMGRRLGGNCVANARTRPCADATASNVLLVDRRTWSWSAAWRDTAERVKNVIVCWNGVIG